jgi:hypothetical protein
MTPTNPLTNPYRQQITGLARALATARSDDVRGGLADPATLPGVEWYLTSCAGQRYRSLTKGTELLTEAFADLHELKLAYIREVPLAAYDPNSGDGKRFLEWLKLTREMTPEEQDYWDCQWAPHAIAALARKNRLGHLHFQELCSVAGLLASELETNPDLRVVLNPIRSWAQFRTTALLEGAGTPPVDVLFFATGIEVSTAVLEPPGPALVRELADSGPWTLDEWACLSKQADREQLAALCRDLAAMGLVAFQ